jgi:catechol 2,3-dioxygenase-like lactoylglutathione lyase family enzyme
MIDHTSVAVTDIKKSKAWYIAALEPIGYKVIKEVPASVTGDGDAVGFGEPPKPDFWLGEGKPGTPIHVAFRAEQRSQVDAFYKAAIRAGGTDNGPPGIRAHYHPNYYGAFVLDPDGHNIEVVCHSAA